MRFITALWKLNNFAMAMAPVLLFGPALLRLAKRYVFRQPIRVHLRVPRKGICLLTAFVMLLGPENFQQLAEAEVQYANISTASWANGDTIITYIYDDNGSVTSKTTATGGVVKEVVTYQYNLAGRLDKVTTDEQTVTEHVVEYIYNDEGIRVRASSYDQPTGGGTKSNEKTVTYLIDSYNHTGYAQVLEEWTVEGVDAALTCYTLGDDVIAQTKSDWQLVASQWELQGTGNTEYLLYDGHGSTRQLAEYAAGTVSIVDSFSYDGYGVLLQNDSVASANPGKVVPQQTSLLYAGEQFDTDLQQYYLRARYYNPLNGLFNRMDPFSGSPQDPQSLHKYLYAHCNPISNIDPSGLEAVDVVETNSKIAKKGHYRVKRIRLEKYLESKK
jgi:RHS repeat-associated protein